MHIIFMCYYRKHLLVTLNTHILAEANSFCFNFNLYAIIHVCMYISLSSIQFHIHFHFPLCRSSLSCLRQFCTCLVHFFFVSRGFFISSHFRIKFFHFSNSLACLLFVSFDCLSFPTTHIETIFLFVCFILSLSLLGHVSQSHSIRPRFNHFILIINL